MEELIAKKLSIFKHYRVDPKEIKCSFQWWEKHESLSLIIDLLAFKILGTLKSQIEIKGKKNLYILTNIKRYHLQSNNLEKLKFVRKIRQVILKFLI